VVSGLLAHSACWAVSAAGFVIAALVSSYLHLLSVAVGGRPPGLATSSKASAPGYGNVLSVLFALWFE